jgi:outer membrane protein OmpA-like peptidoglycan-associated protein
MNAWIRIFGKRRNGAFRATSILGIAAATLMVLSGSEEWIATPLPGGTTIYVRYGTPGGVRIHRGGPAEAAATDSAASSTARLLGTSPGISSAGAPAPTGAWADSLTAQIRRILAEELAELPVASRTTITIARSPAPPVADTLASPADTAHTAHLAHPAQGASSPDTLAVSPEPRLAAPASPALEARVPDTLADTLAAPPEPPRADLPPESRSVREAFTGDGLFTTQLLLFETGESELLPLSQDILRVVAGVLREFPEARVRVEGYTDRRGRAQANLDLSRRRAEAVRDFLAGEGGLGPDRVEAVGYGEEHPAIEGSTPTALALNRRVQIRVLNPETLRRSVENR